MKILSQIIIISLLAVFAWGAFTINHGSHQGHEARECVIGSTSPKQDCSLLSKGLEFAIFHINALKDFSIAIFLQQGILLVSILLTTFLFFKYRLGLSTSSVYTPLQSILFYSLKKELGPISKSDLEKLSWLALLNHSPTSSLK